uniref:Uncharacterized protein n=1 Tax=Oryza rufipogon TaxID=4529 RepID=A0A0E0PST7_ORYRU
MPAGGGACRSCGKLASLNKLSHRSESEAVEEKALATETPDQSSMLYGRAGAEELIMASSAEELVMALPAEDLVKRPRRRTWSWRHDAYLTS